MADDKNVKDEVAKVQDAENRTSKRRLRTSTETVRERTRKLQTQAKLDAEPSGRNVFSTFLWGFTWPLRQFGQFVGKLGRFRVIRFVTRVLGRVLLPVYFRNSWRELRLVTWPDRRTSWKLTYAVIVFSILFGVIIAAVDFVLDKLFKELIIK